MRSLPRLPHPRPPLVRPQSRRRDGAPVRLGALVLGAAIVASACGAGGAAADPDAGAPSLAPVVAGIETRYENAVLAPDLRIVEPADIDGALVSAERIGIGTTFRYDPARAGALADVKVGDVVILGGAGPRKVDSIYEKDGALVVATLDASLGDVIESGTVGWTYGLDWGGIETAAWMGASEPGGLELASVDGVSPQVMRELAVKGKELRFVGQVKGFEVELKLVPSADKMDFELSAQKTQIKVQAKGWISSFVQETVIEFDGGEGTLFTTENRGLRGEAEIEWAALQKSSEAADDVTAIDIPLELPIPFTVGPVPMTMRLKAGARIVPAFNGDGSSGGSFKVTYSSDHGFTSNGGAVTPVAKIVNFAADLGQKETVTASVLPAGFAFGVEFPRLELALGHPLMDHAGLQTYAFLTLNQYANGMFTPGTTLSGDIPPCQRASLQVSAIAGYKLSVLGFAELSDNSLLWEKKVDRYKDGKPCTLTGS